MPVDPALTALWPPRQKLWITKRSQSRQGSPRKFRRCLRVVAAIVHLWAPGRGLDDPNADGREYRVQRRDELGAPVPGSRTSGRRPDLSGLTSRLRACWVTHAPGVIDDARQVHVPGAVLDEEQHVQALPEHRAGVEAVCLRGSPWPARPGTPARCSRTAWVRDRCRVLDDPPHRRPRDFAARPVSTPWMRGSPTRNLDRSG